MYKQSVPKTPSLREIVCFANLLDDIGEYRDAELLDDLITKFASDNDITKQAGFWANVWNRLKGRVKRMFLSEYKDLYEAAKAANEELKKRVDQVNEDYKVANSYFKNYDLGDWRQSLLSFKNLKTKDLLGDFESKYGKYMAYITDSFNKELEKTQKKSPEEFDKMTETSEDKEAKEKILPNIAKWTPSKSRIQGNNERPGKEIRVETEQLNNWIGTQLVWSGKDLSIDKSRLKDKKAKGKFNELLIRMIGNGKWKIIGTDDIYTYLEKISEEATPIEKSPEEDVSEVEKILEPKVPEEKSEVKPEIKPEVKPEVKPIGEPEVTGGEWEEEDFPAPKPPIGSGKIPKKVLDIPLIEDEIESAVKERERKENVPVGGLFRQKAPPPVEVELSPEELAQQEEKLEELLAPEEDEEKEIERKFIESGGEEEPVGVPEEDEEDEEEEIERKFIESGGEEEDFPAPKAPLPAENIMGKPEAVPAAQEEIKKEREEARETSLNQKTPITSRPEGTTWVRYKEGTVYAGMYAPVKKVVPVRHEEIKDPSVIAELDRLWAEREEPIRRIRMKAAAQKRINRIISLAKAKEPMVKILSIRG